MTRGGIIIEDFWTLYEEIKKAEKEAPATDGGETKDRREPT